MKMKRKASKFPEYVPLLLRLGPEKFVMDKTLPIRSAIIFEYNSAPAYDFLFYNALGREPMRILIQECDQVGSDC